MSISSIVSSIRRRWSSESSTLPVTFSDARSVSSTTSRRTASRSFTFSASIALRFSSSRRSRSFDGLLAGLRELLLALLSALFEDALALGLRLLALLPCELAELAGLLTGLVGLVERLANTVAPLVDQPLDAPEGQFPEDEEDDRKRDDRPDHQAGNDRDQVAAAVLLLREDECFEHPLDQYVGQEAAEERVEDDRLGQREAEPLDAGELAA